MGELRQLMDSYGITPKGQQDRRWVRPVHKPQTYWERQRAAAAAETAARERDSLKERIRSIEAEHNARPRSRFRDLPGGSSRASDDDQ